MTSGLKRTPWLLLRRTWTTSAAAATVLPTSTTATPPLTAQPGALDEPRIFVSSHYELEDREVELFLTRQRVPFTSGPRRVTLTDCVCTEHGGQADGRAVVTVDQRQGSYSCAKCGRGGSWFDLKRLLSGQPPLEPAIGQSKDNSLSASDVESAARAYVEAAPTIPEAASFIASVGLLPQTLEKYGVGATRIRFTMDATRSKIEDHVCLTYPQTMGAQAQVVRIKAQSITNERCLRLQPKKGDHGLFGWQTVSAEAKSLVVTENELDAMAVWQSTQIDVLPLLERFERIYLWLHDDVAGQECAEKHARKLGLDRTYIVSSSNILKASNVKTPLEALTAGTNLKELLDRADKVPHQQIQRFQSLRATVFNELSNPQQVAGVQSTMFPSLNNILKGHRRGEFTIVTGPTGIGKTSFLAQLSLDYAMQGVSTLWGSFEIKNVRLAKKMLNMFSGRNLEDDIAAFDHYADRFEQLPLHFLKFFGSTKVELVLDAMEHAVYVYDVEHIVLDNLQFMTSGQGKGFERFELHDRAIELLRAFATNKNVHVTIVIHPRKEDDDQPLMTSSIFGTAKATQEADNVIIIQRGRRNRCIEVKKNRFDGTLGVIPYDVDKDSGLIRELVVPVVPRS